MLEKMIYIYAKLRKKEKRMIKGTKENVKKKKTVKKKDKRRKREKEYFFILIS